MKWPNFIVIKNNLYIIMILSLTISTSLYSKYIPTVVKTHISFKSKKSKFSKKELTRKGILTKAENAKATILICHGYMCDKYDVSFIPLLLKQYNTLSFDFRAHGELSDNQICTLGKSEAYDVAAAVDYIKSHKDLKNKPIVVYGFSMGAVASILAQSENQNLFDCMILDCPFESSDKLIDRGLENFNIDFFGYKMPIPWRSLLKKCAYHPYTQSLIKHLFKAFSQFNATGIDTRVSPIYTEKSASKINVPCFFITCKNDDKVPVSAVIEIFNQVPSFKRLWVTDGRRHYDSLFRDPELYFYKISRFIDKVIDNRISKKVTSKIIQE